MQFKIAWSSEALLDLEELYTYYREKSETVAADIHNSILDDVALLANFPVMAPLEPMLKEMSKTYRSLVVAKGLFKVIYFAENKCVFTTHIWNCKQNPERLKISVR